MKFKEYLQELMKSYEGQAKKTSRREAAKEENGFLMKHLKPILKEPQKAKL